MMKKYSWIAALVVALSFAFVGCSGTLPGDDDDGRESGGVEFEEKTVFDLSTDKNIQALTVGPLSFADDANPISPFMRAGGDTQVSFEAVEVDGKKSLKFTASDTWGPGFDLLLKDFGFRKGDKITIAGELLSAVGYTQPNFLVGKENGHGFKQSTAAKFKWDITVDDSILKDIRDGMNNGKSYPAIRIEGRGNGVIVRIDELKVVGQRPKGITKNEAPVVTVSGNVISWEAVDGASGYKITEAEDKIAEFTVAATSFNLADNLSIPEGKYNIKVTALATSGESTDSDPSAAKEVTKKYPELTISFGGSDMKVGLAVSGGTLEVSGKQYTITYPSSGNYPTVYVTFDVTLPKDKNLSDYTKISFLYFAQAGDSNGKRGIVLGGDKGAFNSGIDVNNLQIATTTANDGSGGYSMNAGLTAQTVSTENSSGAVLRYVTGNAEKADGKTVVSVAVNVGGAQPIGNVGGIGTVTKYTIGDITFSE